MKFKYNFYPIRIASYFDGTISLKPEAHICNLPHLQDAPNTSRAAAKHQRMILKCLSALPTFILLKNVSATKSARIGKSSCLG